MQNQIEGSKIEKGQLEGQLGEEHTNKIIETIKQAPENIKNVWNKFISKVNINSDKRIISLISSNNSTALSSNIYSNIGIVAPAIN